MPYYTSERFSHTVFGAVRAAVRLLFAFIYLPWLVLYGRAVHLAGKLTADPIRSRGHLARTISRGVLRVFGVELEVSGTIPSGSFLFASNHLSWLDPFLLLTVLNCRFVAQMKYLSVPFLAGLMRMGHGIYLNRLSLSELPRVNAEIKAALSGGDSVLIFPEATTSRGESVLPVRGATLTAAVELGLPVHWGLIRYVVPPGWPPASISVCWHDWTPLPLQMFRMLHLPRIRAAIHFAADPVMPVSRKQGQAELERRMREAFRPLEQVTAEELERIYVPPPPGAEIV